MYKLKPPICRKTGCVLKTLKTQPAIYPNSKPIQKDRFVLHESLLGGIYISFVDNNNCRRIERNILHTIIDSCGGNRSLIG